MNRKRVERLMREARIQGIYRMRGRKNLVNAATEEDLGRRNFTAEWPDALWLTDITEHPTGEGKLYCAAVMAAFPSDHRLVDCRPPGHRPSRQRPFHDRRTAAAGERENGAAFRSRHAVHGLGVREENPRCEDTRLDGNSGRLLRQRYDGIILAHYAARAPPTKGNGKPGNSSVTPSLNG